MCNKPSTTSDMVADDKIDPSLHFNPSVVSGLTHLYLSGNLLTELPYNFFRYFPELRWLDLRNNKLTRIYKEFITTSKEITPRSYDDPSQEKNFLIEVCILSCNIIDLLKLAKVLPHLRHFLSHKKGTTPTVGCIFIDYSTKTIFDCNVYSSKRQDDGIISMI